MDMACSREATTMPRVQHKPCHLTQSPMPCRQPSRQQQQPWLNLLWWVVSGWPLNPTWWELPGGARHSQVRFSQRGWTTKAPKPPRGQADAVLQA